MNGQTGQARLSSGGKEDSTDTRLTCIVWVCGRFCISTAELQEATSWCCIKWYGDMSFAEILKEIGSAFRGDIDALV